MPFAFAFRSPHVKEIKHVFFWESAWKPSANYYYFKQNEFVWVHFLLEKWMQGLEKPDSEQRRLSSVLVDCCWKKSKWNVFTKSFSAFLFSELCKPISSTGLHLVLIKMDFLKDFLFCMISCADQYMRPLSLLAPIQRALKKSILGGNFQTFCLTDTPPQKRSVPDRLELHSD